MALLLAAISSSPSLHTLEKIYLKKNALDSPGPAQQLCELVARAHQLVTVHLNWTGIKLKLEAGVRVQALSVA